jgi:hypothetical protein
MSTEAWGKMLRSGTSAWASGSESKEDQLDLGLNENFAN